MPGKQESAPGVEEEEKEEEKEEEERLYDGVGEGAGTRIWE